MNARPLPLPKRLGGSQLAVLLALAILPASSTRAGESVFDRIPGDVAAVIGINNLEQMQKRLVDFGRRIDPGFDGIDLGEFERTLGFNPGTIDLSKPIYFIVPSPVTCDPVAQLKALGASRALGDGLGEFPIVSFEPKHPDTFRSSPRIGVRRERRQRGPFGTYFILVRGETIFIADSSAPLKHIRRMRSRESLASSLSPRMHKSMRECDVFVHIPFDSWRDRLSPWLTLAAGMVKIGMTADEDATRAGEIKIIADWAVRGFQKLVDEAKGVNFCLAFDGNTFRIDHHVTFVPHGQVAGYLDSVQRRGFDSWAHLPDRPFYVAGAWDWRVPPDQAITLGVNQLCMSIDSVRQQYSEPTREKMAAYARDCAAATHGTQFMITSPPGQSGPMQFVGADIVDAPARILEKYRYLQENTCEMMSMFMYGGGAFGGKFSSRRRGSCDYLEMQFDNADMSRKARDELVAVYGEGVRFQETAVGDSHIAFTIAQPVYGVCDMVEAIRQGRSLSGNRRVHRATSRLLKDSNITLLLDAGRILEAMPGVLAGREQQSADSDENARETLSATPMKSTIGPLVGWSCRVRKNALECRLALDADDFEALLSHVKLFMHRGTATDQGGSAPAPPLVWTD